MEKTTELIKKIDPKALIAMAVCVGIGQIPAVTAFVAANPETCTSVVGGLIAGLGTYIKKQKASENGSEEKETP